MQNGRVATLDTQQPWAEAVAMAGDSILAVGATVELEKFSGPRTKVIDLGGRLVIPGFNDAHCHLLSGGLSLLRVNLLGATTAEEIKRRVAEKVRESPPGSWIRGRGWDHTLFNRGRWPDKSLLDSVADGHPIFLMRVDGHVGWANSEAFRLAGITSATPDPPGGEIVRDPETKEPTGIFKENAVDLINTVVPPPTKTELTLALEKALVEARRLGVTSVQEQSDPGDFPGGYEVYREFFDAGKLTLRIDTWLALNDATKPHRLDSLQALFPKAGGWLRAGMLKGFTDGSMGSRTALFFAPYSDDPTTSGIAGYTQDSLNNLVRIGDSLGYQIGLHAIGDKANYMALKAFDFARLTNGPKTRRHRLEHAQVMRPQDIEYCARLGVVALMQPTHCTSDMRWAEDRVGKERCKGAYAWRSFLDNRVPLAFGTDWPVEPLDPMEGIYSAVTRQPREVVKPLPESWMPEQRITVEEAVRAYTFGSAYAEFQEEKKGSIAPGKLADLVVLSQNIFTIPPREILSTKVDLTIVGGKVVFERK